MDTMSTMRTHDQGDIKTVRAVERAVDVLMCFTRDRPALSVTELERTLALSRPTLYRLLHTLEGKGFIRSFGDPQRFRLGHRAIELGEAASARLDVARVAEPLGRSRVALPCPPAGLRRPAAC